MRKRARLFEYRDHWLDRRGETFYACRLDRAARQVRRASLRTSDLEQAKDRLIEWVLEHGEVQPGDPRRVSVAECLQRYYLQHAQHLPSREQARLSSRQLLEELGEASVADLTPVRQQRLIAALQKGGRASGTVSRLLSVLRAALKHAEKYQLLTHTPFIFDVKRGAPRDRVLTFDELRELFRHAAPHLRMFIVLAIGTGARRGAILDLARDRCDLERRRIELNPAGREQTKKRRPTVPLVPSLVPWIEAAEGPYLVSYHGQPVASIKTAWRLARTAAGLGAEVIPNTIRHTVATMLREAGVPEAECAAFLGHRWSNSTTEGYAKHRPDYLSQAAAVVDRLISEVAGTAIPATSETTRRMHHNCVPMAQSPRASSVEKAAKFVVGATGIEPVTTTMST